MDETDIVYLALSLVAIFIVLASIGSFGKGWDIAALLFTLVALGLIFTLNWADFVVFPLFAKIFGITFQPAKDYTIVKSQDAVVKSVGGLFYATSFVTGNLFSYSFKEEEVESDVEEKMTLAPENWERAVMSIAFPFKFHVLSVGRDVQKIRDDLEGRRSYQEFQLSRSLQNEKASNETAVTNIRRKIDIIQAKIDRISGGEKPISSIMYFETTSVGVSEKAALDALSLQVKQLQVAMSPLNLQLSRIAGRELYSLFRYNFALPLNYGALAQEFSVEG